MKNMMRSIAVLLLSVVLAVGMAACGGTTEAQTKLKAIAVTTKPTKIEYVAGEIFDATGMVVTAAYDDGSTKEVTGYTWNKTAPLTEEDASVRISYTEKEVTKTTNLAITVKPGTDHLRYHEFNAQGVCSCGALKFEAENATITGTPSGSSETFLVESDRASGGVCVGNWMLGDNRWTTYLNLTEATDAVLGICFAPTTISAPSHTLPWNAAEADRGVKGSNLWAFEMRVNGNILSYQSTTVPTFDGSSYFEWKVILTNPVSFLAGENRVEIESWDNYGMNIDYIFVNLPSGAEASFSKDAAKPEHVHAFTEGVCSCGAVKIEAEDCTVTGTPASWAAPEGFYRSSDGASGNKKVGAWGVNGDNKIYISLTSDKAYDNVTMSFIIQTGGMVNPEGFIFCTYDEATSTKGEAITHGSLQASIGTWTEILSQEFSIAAGKNLFVIEAFASCEVDWDCFIINGLPVDAVITATKYEVPEVPVDPVHTHTFTEGVCSCGAVKIEAEDCTVTGTPASWAAPEGFYRSADGASGNRKVGAWGVNGDNKIYITFTSDKAYENVTMSFIVQTGGLVNPEGFIFCTYDEATSTKGASISHGTLSSGISSWTEIKSAEFSVKAGQNTFVIEAYASCEVDWDCFILNGIPAGAVITASQYEIPVDPAHTHTFTEGVCSCGAVKIEAEDCTVTGTPASWAAPEGFYRSADGASGNRKVGAWGVNGDNKIYITFTSDKAYENVTMSFIVQTGGLVNSEGFIFYAYDEDTSTKGASISHETLSSGISSWTEIKSAGFSVKAGQNTFVIEAYASCEVDWDCFVLNGLPASANIKVSIR